MELPLGIEHPKSYVFPVQHKKYTKVLLKVRGEKKEKGIDMSIACCLDYIVERFWLCIAPFAYESCVLPLSLCVTQAHFKLLSSSTHLPQLPKYVGLEVCVIP